MGRVGSVLSSRGLLRRVAGLEVRVGLGELV